MIGLIILVIILFIISTISIYIVINLNKANDNVLKLFGYIPLADIKKFSAECD